MGATIYNSDLTKGLASNAKIQTAKDKVPNELAEKVVPTMETNPELLRKSTILTNIERSTTTSASPGTTLYTASSTKDTYITALSLSATSSAACDNTIIRIRVTVNNQAVILLALLKETLTLNSQTATLTLTYPLKIDRGTNISLLNVFTAGSSNLNGCVLGYEVDNTQA